MANFDLESRYAVEDLGFTNETFKCGECGNKTPMRAICSGSISELVCFCPPEPLAVHRWFVLCCPICTHINVICVSDWIGTADTYLDEFGHEREDVETTTNTIFPADPDLPRPNPDMPACVAEDFNEARRVFPVSPRGAAALLGLSVQKLCKELGQKGKDLNDEIGKLVEAGLPEHIQQALDLVRVIGNEAVHPGTLDVRDQPEIARRLFGVVNDIVEDRISKPRKEQEIRKQYNTLPKAKLDEIDKRNKRTPTALQGKSVASDCAQPILDNR